jgi:hypothetical protein
MREDEEIVCETNQATEDKGIAQSKYYVPQVCSGERIIGRDELHNIAEIIANIS